MVDITVIGGGASGMMAAITAARSGAKVVLLERQARVGRKLLSTGNGRCNLSNTGASAEHYHGEEPGFVSAALKRFDVEDTLKFFRELGLLTVEEYGGRIYPLSGQANSVLDVLRFALESSGVKVITGAEVKQAWRSGNGFGAAWQDGNVLAKRLVVACGGCAGSKLGGVMDGYKILCSFGHSRTALYPALTQVRTEGSYPRSLKGVRADALVTVLSGKRSLGSRRGELLFTDNGVSGTVIFELSRDIAAGKGDRQLHIDFLPDYSRDELMEYLYLRRKQLPELPGNQVLTGAVHNRLGQMLCRYAGVGTEPTAGELEDRQLKEIAEACRNFRLTVTGVSGFESAQVTAGGVRTREFDANTLGSRLVPGLFACGEVLDADGDCGGYNLQWAWSSGYVAGRVGK